MLTAATAAGALAALAARRWRWAQTLAVAESALIVLGWALAHAPYAIEPSLTLRDAAAPAPVLAALLWVLGLGSLVLVPAFAYLYIVFKGGDGRPKRASRRRQRVAVSE